MIHLIHLFLNQLTIFIFKGGRKKLKNEIIGSINSHMLSLSSIAANRYLKKIDKNAFYCSVSTVEAFLKFENADNISFSTFYNYVGKEFKKPHRFSDLCEYCENNKVSFTIFFLNIYCFISFDSKLK
jgi:hypothetical protein